MKLSRAFVLLILFVSLSAHGQHWGEETFAVYGYLVSYTHTSVEEWEEWEEPTVGHALFIRLKADWHPQENLEFHIETGWSADRAAENVVDHAWGLVNLGLIDVQIGKMPIGWGTGYLFNPSARTAPAGLLNTRNEETPGTIAVAPTFYVTDRVSLLAYLAFQDRTGQTLTASEDSRAGSLPFGIKMQSFLGAFDLTAGLVREVFFDADGDERACYGILDLDGGLGGLGLYGETAVRLPQSAGDSFDPLESLEGVLGLYYTLNGPELDVRAEYFHQGSGTRRRGPEDLEVLMSGRRLVLAEDYLFASIERIFVDYLTVSAGALVNLNDGSWLALPELRYDLYDNFEVTAGGVVALGEAGTEFGGPPFGSTTIYFRGQLSF